VRCRRVYIHATRGGNNQAYAWRYGGEDRAAGWLFGRICPTAAAFDRPPQPGGGRSATSGGARLVDRCAVYAMVPIRAVRRFVRPRSRT
jgi:hypothetical protein